MSLFTHEKHHHVTRNLNDIHDEHLRLSDKIADKVAAGMGSMRFIVIQSVFLAAWILWNTASFLPHFDPMPFILLNLCLSFQAGYAAPFIMVSQNRQAAKDRIAAEEDYAVNRRGEYEIQQMIAHLDAQDQKILEIAQHTARLMEILEKKY